MQAEKLSSLDEFARILQFRKLRVSRLKHNKCSWSRNNGNKVLLYIGRNTRSRFPNTRSRKNLKPKMINALKDMKRPGS